MAHEEEEEVLVVSDGAPATTTGATAGGAPSGDDRDGAPVPMPWDRLPGHVPSPDVLFAPVSRLAEVMVTNDNWRDVTAACDAVVRQLQPCTPRIDSAGGVDGAAAVGFPAVDSLHPFWGDLFEHLYNYRDVVRPVDAAFELGEATLAIVRSEQAVSPSTASRELLVAARTLSTCVADIARDTSGPLRTLREVASHMRTRLPRIDTSADACKRTVVVAGMPNTGKSTLVNKLSGDAAACAAEPYSFTTKGLQCVRTSRMSGSGSGSGSGGDLVMWQVIDTPALMGHLSDEGATGASDPYAARAEQLAAVTALAHLNAAVAFVVDVSEACGFTVEEQLNVFAQTLSLQTGSAPGVVAMTSTAGVSSEPSSHAIAMVESAAERVHVPAVRTWGEGHDPMARLWRALDPSSDEAPREERDALGTGVAGAGAGEGASLTAELLGAFYRAGAAADDGTRTATEHSFDESATLYVGNIAFSADLEDLRDVFEGAVDVRMPVDRDNGEHRGFAFVTMPDAAAAASARERLNGAVLDGRALRVELRRQRSALGSSFERRAHSAAGDGDSGVDGAQGRGLAPSPVDSEPRNIVVRRGPEGPERQPRRTGFVTEGTPPDDDPDRGEVVVRPIADPGPRPVSLAPAALARGSAAADRASEGAAASGDAGGGGGDAGGGGMESVGAASPPGGWSDAGVKVFVGGLAPEFTLHDFMLLFGRDGVPRARQMDLVTDGGRCRGFGFATFSSSDDAQVAIEALESNVVRGHRLRARVAIERAAAGAEASPAAAAPAAPVAPTATPAPAVPAPSSAGQRRQGLGVSLS